MTVYRSTTLRLVERHCPAALGFYEQGAPADYSMTERGTAAHHVLQEAGERADQLDRALTEDERHALASEVVVRLTTEGRSFDGQPEPPLSLQMAREGAELAVEWLAEHNERPGQYELALAIDKEGKGVPYDSPKAWYRGILDTVFTEEYLERVLVIRDYKSFYSAGEALLHGVQMQGQAVLAVGNGLHLDDYDVLRLEIGNLRTRVIHKHDVYLRHSSGEETLRRWRLHLVRLTAGLEKVRRPDGSFPASPGPCCAGCPYLGNCEDARRYYDGEGLPATKTERARALAVVEARREQIREACKADCDNGPVSVDGKLLGFHVTDTETPDDMIGMTLETEWKKRGGNVAGLIYAMKPTTEGLRSVARQLFPGDREAQEQWLKPMLTTKPRTEFGFRDITDADLTVD